MERLPDAELEVMQALWALDRYPAHTSDLSARLSKDWKAPTLLKLLSRLEERFNPYEHFATHTDVRRTAGLYSYLKLSQLMLRIMEQRKESRGPHFRADYPETNPEFEGSMIAQRDGEEIKLTLKRQD